MGQRSCESDDVEAHLSQRYTFLFVWTGEKHYYSRLGCVIVTFDQQSYELKCNCNHGKQISCLHKSISKWFLFSKFPSLDFGNSEKSESCSSMEVFLGFQLEYPICKMADYELRKMVRLDEAPVKEKFDENLVILPKEEQCQVNDCVGILTTEDSGRKNCKLLTRGGVVMLRKVWVKVCPNCSVECWYNDVCDGIFNYNNQFFISVELLKWICNSLYLSIAISTNIRLL